MEDNPQDYYLTRLDYITEQKKKGINSYPHKFNGINHQSLGEFIMNYSNDSVCASGQRLEDITISVTGRIHAIRSSGKKLFFYDLIAEGNKIQVLADQKASTQSGTDTPVGFREHHSTIKRGDIVGITGFPGKSKKGELSIIPHSIEVLTPCLHTLPTLHFGVHDKELRYRKRYLDLIMNNSTRQTFITRSKIIQILRQFLVNRGFLEVETPTMNVVAGGATAKPFVTHHNDLKMDMFMRVAPELYLKQLVVGGFDKVFEIGRVYRNEDIDLTHNPEFTICEFYQAYADYYDLQVITEVLLSQLAFEIFGSYNVPKNEQLSVSETEPEVSENLEFIDFTPPFRKIDMITELQNILQVKFPHDLSTLESNKFLDDLCKKNNIECPTPRTTARLLDKLVGIYIEPQCINPTFICNHPVIMSPLAKYHRDNENLTERFELFICGKEICNAYTELNDPQVQRSRFEEQALAKSSGDSEAMDIDNTFIDALEYGLPPTAGWGMGIDRLVMLFTQCQNIKDVLAFPTMRQLPN